MTNIAKVDMNNSDLPLVLAGGLQSEHRNLKIVLVGDPDDDGGDEETVLWFPAAVIASHSTYVDKMLTSPMIEQETYEAHFEVSHSIWNRMLLYVVDASKELSLEEALLLAKYYDKYDFPVGRKLCDKVIRDYLPEVAVQEEDDLKSLAEKGAVILALFNFAEDHGDRLPTKKELALACKCSAKYAAKIIGEVIAGTIVDPAIKDLKRFETNFGARTLSMIDKLTLLMLHEEMPGRSLPDMQKQLFAMNGTQASTSTISDWFLYCNTYRGMRKTNPVPIAKYTELNKARFEVCRAILDGSLNPWKIKFVDQKVLKAMEMFGSKCRVCPLTGRQPYQSVPKDFRVRWSIIGLIGLFGMAAPVVFRISQANTDAEMFMDFMVECVVTHNLQRNDVLILDNVPWQTKTEAEVLQEFLWSVPCPVDGQPLHVFVVFLPTYCAELSPIGLVWHIFLKKHRDRVLHQFRDGQLNGEEDIARIAAEALRTVWYQDVLGCYQHCNYLPRYPLFSAP